jgi:hypothetical protein
MGKVKNISYLIIFLHDNAVAGEIYLEQSQLNVSYPKDTGCILLFPSLFTG